MPLVASVQGTENSNLKVALTMSQGESVATQLTFTNRCSGIPVNLAGYYAKMTINFASALILDTDNGGITVPNASGGVLQLNIASAVSEQFQPGSYPYDLFTRSPEGFADRVMAGSFNVLQSVTDIV